MHEAVVMPSFAWTKHWALCMKLSLCQVSLEQNTEPHAWSCRYAKFHLNKTLSLMHEAVVMPSFTWTKHWASCMKLSLCQVSLEQNTEPHAWSCRYAKFHLNKTLSLMHEAVVMPSFTWTKHWASCMKLSLCQVSLEQNTEPYAWSCRYAKFHLNKTLSLMHEAVVMPSFTWTKHWASCMKLSLCQVSLEQNTEHHAWSCLYNKFHLEQNSEPHAWSCRFAKFRFNKTLSLIHDAVFIMTFT